METSFEIGTFIKTVSPHIVELLGTTPLDFGVIDAEHAPFDRQSIDLLLLAGKAAQLPLYVRIPDRQPATILSVLDLGAAGIVVPHVNDAEQARQIVSRAKYLGGERGFSSSPRAAGYGTDSYANAQARGDQTRIICQIESVAGLQNCQAIAETPGVDALFIGRADLALSLGESNSRHPKVLDATDRIIAATLAAGKQAAMFVGNLAERDEFRAKGVTWFVFGSDQSFLRQGAQQACANRPEVSA